MNRVFKILEGDRAIWLITFFLMLASLLLVYSSIVTLAYKYHSGNTTFYLLRHGFFLVVGLGIIYLIHKMRYTYLSRISQLLLFLAVPLLLLTLLLGANINEASRWLVIPVINQSFQTSDLAKLALILYVARMLSLKQADIKSFNVAFVPIVLPIILVCGLIFPANFSTAAVLFTVCLVLMFIGGIPVKYLLGLVGTGIFLVIFALLIGKVVPDLIPRAGTWVKRIESFSEPDSKGNYQVEQSKIAIAKGGFFRLTPGKSTQRNFLPHPYSDFIYAIVIEEYGFVGGGVILLLYLTLFFRSMRIVAKKPNSFGSLMVIGISFSLVFQALINMAVAVNLLPVTGQPLPLVSMGGTSMWFTCIGIGIILSVSRTIESEYPSDLSPNLQNKNEYAGA